MYLKARSGSLFIILAACTPALAQQPPMQMEHRPPVRQIVTSAVGEAQVTPDRGTIEISVQTRAETAAQAASENARKQEAVLDTLRDLGLADRQLSTVNYNVHPEMRYDEEDQRSYVVGYVVTNTVRAEVTDLGKVGPAIDASIARGANMITSLTFTSSRHDEVRRTALADAVAAARTDAEVLARAGGGSLGALLELTTAEIPPVRPYTRMMRLEAADMAASTPIEPGEHTVTTSVSGRWEFVPGN